jgi:CRISPR-associated protein Csb3
MIRLNPNFSVRADVTNPGHFFACCGLLELSHRIWPGAEGWFDAKSRCFVVSQTGSQPNLQRLLGELRACSISGLTKEERKERVELDREEKELKELGEKLPEDKEARKKELGKQARAGSLQLEYPFDLLLDWWKVGDDEVSPKTWAGRQEIHKIARAAQCALPESDDISALLDHGCILHKSDEYCKKRSDHEESVEPFYFDARRFANALDAGFSLDTIEAETIAHPAVELLVLIGLQRFRPCPTSVKWNFEYKVWRKPLPALAAAGVVCGAVPIHGSKRHCFTLRFRDNQKRYKAFGWATSMEERNER